MGKKNFAQIHIYERRRNHPRMLRFFRNLSEYRSELLRRSGFGHSGTPCSPPSRRRGGPSPSRRVGEWTPHRSDCSTARPTAPAPAHPIQQRLSSTSSVLSPSFQASAASCPPLFPCICGNLNIFSSAATEIHILSLLLSFAALGRRHRPCVDSYHLVIFFFPCATHYVSVVSPRPCGGGASPPPRGCDQASRGGPRGPCYDC